MSFSHNVIGRYGRAKLRQSRPFTSLLLDIAQDLEEAEVAALKLAICSDKLTTKREFARVKHSSDALRYSTVSFVKFYILLLFYYTVNSAYNELLGTMTNISLYPEFLINVYSELVPCK